MSSSPTRNLARAARLYLLIGGSILALAGSAQAGGGPANVMVLYNAGDPDSTSVARAYEQARSLLPGYLCGIKGLDKAQTSIDVPTYLKSIQAPFDACLAALPAGQADEVDYLVLVRGLPYSVSLPKYTASLEAMLQIHHAKDGSGKELSGLGQALTQGVTAASLTNPQYIAGNQAPDDYTVMNQYSIWYSSATGIVRADSLPAGFRRKSPTNAGDYDYTGNLFIVSRLDGFDYTDAKALIDRAVKADGTNPMAELLCMQAEDGARGARDPECEFATRYLKGAGFNATYLKPFDGALKGHTLAAYFSGSAATIKGAIAGNTYAPGAITDDLTSLAALIQNFSCNDDGSVCPANEAQTSVARYVRAGATGAHGMVNEPLNNTFPNAGALLLYTFGYSMGESYFFNQQFLHWQNIYLGDPLTTPYATRPKIVLPDPMTVEAGGVLTVAATHANGVAGMNLYVGGVRVAQAQSGQISFAPKDAAGTKLQILVTATSKNAPVMRAGWPVPNQMPAPDVQGWTTATIEIVAAVPRDMAVTVDAAAPDAGTSAPKGGCSVVGGHLAGEGGPTATTGMMGMLLMGLCLALLRVRARRRPGL